MVKFSIKKKQQWNDFKKSRFCLFKKYKIFNVCMCVLKGEREKSHKFTKDINSYTGKCKSFFVGKNFPFMFITRPVKYCSRYFFWRQHEFVKENKTPGINGHQSCFRVCFVRKAKLWAKKCTKYVFRTVMSM